MFQSHVAENIFDPINMEAESLAQAQSDYAGYGSMAGGLVRDSSDYSPRSFSSTLNTGMIPLPTTMFPPFSPTPVCSPQPLCMRDFSPIRLPSLSSGIAEQDPRMLFYGASATGKPYPTRGAAAMKMKIQESSSHRKGGLAASLSSAFTEVTQQDKGLFSKKVFVGGLPPDIDEDEIRRSFFRFGQVTVDWPTKGQTRHIFPPKGYVFLIFQFSKSVERLVDECLSEEDDYFYVLSSASQRNKLVQVRPWLLSDGECHFDKTKEVNSRLTAFVGGVPRPLRADQLAKIMNDQFGNVCHAIISVDEDMDYPRGAGRVTFSTQDSYINAIQNRYVEVTLGDLQKKVELKPYEDTTYERQKARDHRQVPRRTYG